mmetsp:Transcript_22306/g.65866  ORF Transcript_22306/g.65866 Transcript_22306/m.65866 type:complete len:203 (+) Transcript_22306:668-1276(+)
MATGAAVLTAGQSGRRRSVGSSVRTSSHAPYRRRRTSGSSETLEHVARTRERSQRQDAHAGREWRRPGCWRAIVQFEAGDTRRWNAEEVRGDRSGGGHSRSRCGGDARHCREGRLRTGCRTRVSCEGELEACCVVGEFPLLQRGGWADRHGRRSPSDPWRRRTGGARAHFAVWGHTRASTARGGRGPAGRFAVRVAVYQCGI